MNYREMAMMAVYDIVRTGVPDASEVGAQFNGGRKLTPAQFARFMGAYLKEVERIERRLTSANIDYMPFAWQLPLPSGPCGASHTYE